MKKGATFGFIKNSQFYYPPLEGGSKSAAIRGGVKIQTQGSNPSWSHNHKKTRPFRERVFFYGSA
jgi:hypothetical protein